MNEIERKMLENGFAAKDMCIFRHYMEKDSLLTHLLLLHELKRRFIGVGCFSLLLMLVWLWQYINADHLAFLCFSAAMFFYLLAAYIMIPFGLGLKSVRFLRKVQR
jgi:hypothetical protein